MSTSLYDKYSIEEKTLPKSVNQLLNNPTNQQKVNGLN